LQTQSAHSEEACAYRHRRSLSGAALFGCATGFIVFRQTRLNDTVDTDSKPDKLISLVPYINPSPAIEGEKMRAISEAEFRDICRVVFDNSDPNADETQLLQQLLVMTRSRIGHTRPGTGAFHTGPTMATSLKHEIVSLLMMRREPFFDTSKVISEFMANIQKG
jgi:hypothetical protein